MWSSRLFWKLFLAQAGLIALAVGSCAAIVAGWQEQQLVDQVRRRLHDSTALLRATLQAELPAEPDAAFQSRIAELGQLAQTRFTVVDPTGRVLADSEQPGVEGVRSMDNHLGRPEFVKAKHTGEGESRRVSPTLQVPYLYYAMAIVAEDGERGEARGLVRAAEPLGKVLNEVAGIRRVIWLVGLLVGIAGWLLSYWWTRRIVQRVQSMTVAADAVAAGAEPAIRIGGNSNDELDRLSQSLSDMVQRLARREQQLRENVERHSTVLAGMAEGVIAVNAEEEVLFANDAAGSILGFSPEAAESHSLIELVRDHRIRQAVEQTLLSQEAYRVRIQGVGTQERELEVHATPLPGEPCPGVVLVIDDVTALRKLEGMRQQFVANVSHELKTPLSSIKAYAETLLSGAKDDPEHSVKFLCRIDEQADRLHLLIQDMLSLARIEAGQAAMEVAPLPLAPMVVSILADHESTAESKPVSLVNQVTDGELAVLADEESLRQVLSNLVDNAVKYTPAEGTITVRAKRVADAVEIEVEDTGIGIAPEHQRRLFERFYRVDKARSREMGGTGLGLAIVKHLCQAMQGEVTVRSTLERGSIFCVKLPIAR